jgi:hypothetical protein
MLHYGAGIFFKSAVHRWEFEEDVTSYIEIDAEYVSALRQFVKDSVQLPNNLMITAGIASKIPRFLGFIPPVEMRVEMGRVFAFYVSGILYKMEIGGHITDAQRSLALSSPANKFIFVMDDVESTALTIMRVLASDSKPTDALKELMKQLEESAV